MPYSGFNIVVYFTTNYVTVFIEHMNQFYRFKCIDLDGNGILTTTEMQFFYEEQLHRMECMAQEPVLFEDILCQMIDMIGPEVASWTELLMHFRPVWNSGMSAC